MKLKVNGQGTPSPYNLNVKQLKAMDELLRLLKLRKCNFELYRSIMGFCMKLYLKQYNKDNSDLVIFEEQNNDLDYLISKCKAAYKDWLLENEEGYQRVCSMTYNEFERKLYNCQTILEIVRLCVDNNELSKEFVERQDWLRHMANETTDRARPVPTK